MGKLRPWEDKGLTQGLSQLSGKDRTWSTAFPGLSQHLLKVSSVVCASRCGVPWNGKAGDIREQVPMLTPKDQKKVLLMWAQVGSGPRAQPGGWGGISKGQRSDRAHPCGDRDGHQEQVGG